MSLRRHRWKRTTTVSSLSAREATGWICQAAIWVCAVPGLRGGSACAYLAESLCCHYRLGKPAGAIAAARHWLADYRVEERRPLRRQTRLLLILVRRLSRLVEGYEPPRCGRCCDTGTEWHIARPDVWPLPCGDCYPVERKRMLTARQAARQAALGRAP